LKTTLATLRQSKCATRKENNFLWDEPGKKERKPRKPSKHVLWMKEELQKWCDQKRFKLLEEHKFSEYRKFRFDFAVKEIMVGIEYHGLNSQKSGHTTLVGFTKDQDKSNLAQSEGWKVLAFTVLNYQNVIETLENNLK
jgi:hypothetical protein